ncbi:MAG: hypothetical protein RSA91_05620 [Bacilli bacterium]
MESKKVGGYLFLFLFLAFVGLYFTASSGYYETEERKKTELTAEQIKIFEADIKNGKQIDIENYLKLNEKNYDNHVSTVALSISEKIGLTFEKGINSFFKAVEKAMNSN